MPAPAAIVSATCFSTESPGAMAAAMPPCAQAEEAPSPIGAAASTVTGRGARRRAANRPASPPPRMMTSSLADGTPERLITVMALFSIKRLRHRIDAGQAEHLAVAAAGEDICPAGGEIEAVRGLGAGEMGIADAELAHLVFQVLEHGLADAAEAGLRGDVVQLDLTPVAERADAEDVAVLV